MINFYKDFGIFPDLINLLQLKRIFTFLVDLKKNNKNENICLEDLNLENKNNITYTEFIYSLSITALLFDFDDNFNNIDKLLYLVERMNQSKGVKKWQKKSGKTYSYGNDFISFLIFMKKKYPRFYNINNNCNNNNQINLTDIYGTEDDDNNNNINGNEIQE